MRSTSFETSQTHLVPVPIDPSWIEQGAPIARAVTLSKSPDSPHRRAWDCTAGTFTWILGHDEILHVVEGEVRVRDGSTTHVLVPGSVAYFPRGLETEWEVRNYVKKSLSLCSAAALVPRSSGVGGQARLVARVGRAYGPTLSWPGPDDRPLLSYRYFARPVNPWATMSTL